MDKQFCILKNTKGLHKIGGKPDSGFVLPKNNFIGGVQYLGEISNEDVLFSWLPFNLPLICPIFSDFEMFFVDFKDPNKPKILEPVSSSPLSSAYDEVDKDTKINYEEIKFSFTEIESINDDNEFDLLGIAGTPF